MDIEPRNELMAQACQYTANRLASNFAQAIDQLEKDAAEDMDGNGGEVTMTIKLRLFLNQGKYSYLGDVVTTRKVQSKDAGELHTFVPGEQLIPGLEGDE